MYAHIQTYTHTCTYTRALAQHSPLHLLHLSIVVLKGSRSWRRSKHAHWGTLRCPYQVPWCSLSPLPLLRFGRKS